MRRHELQRQTSIGERYTVEDPVVHGGVNEDLEVSTRDLPKRIGHIHRAYTSVRTVLSRLQKDKITDASQIGPSPQ